MTTQLFVQISDTHIREPGRRAYNRLDTAAYLRQAVESVGRLPQQPQAVVMTGDLTDFGRAAEYDYLGSLLAPLQSQVYLLPGNHDDREQLRLRFPEHTYLGVDGYIQYTVKLGAIRLIALDTVVAGQSHGELCAERLNWLEKTLNEYTHEPVVIAMHHPPFKTLIGHMDKIGLLEGAEALEAIVRRHANIERIICGHLHRAIDVRFGGTVASTTPSPAHQICLDLDRAAEPAWSLEPPGYRVHAWDSDSGRLVTHTICTGQYEGPYPFHMEGALID